uniref:Uncharacterized protein n=1 Tax=Anguilla anguilla TaxID=7936 RepID=A0A0E9SJG2_ANGAN
MQEKCNYSFSFTSNLSLGCIYFYLTMTISDFT